jgi:hypothetical protein
MIDIKADPLIKAQALEDLSLTLRDGLEYLHGICYRGDGGGDGSRDGDAPQFKYFLATTKTEERVCYERRIT